MASRLLSLYRIFNSAAKGADVRPNSWATICAWRKYFALKYESSNEEQDQKEDECNILHDDHHHDKKEHDNVSKEATTGNNWRSSVSCPPVQTVEAVRARNEFIQGLYRGMYKSHHQQHHHHQQQQQQQSWNISVGTASSSMERNTVPLANRDVPIQHTVCTIEQ